MGVGEEGGSPVCVSSHPPSCFSLYCSVCLEKILSTIRHGVCPGLASLWPGAASPLAITAGCPQPWPQAMLPGVQAAAFVVG